MQHSFKLHASSRSSRGFSLLEMLVAFSIMAISLGLIYQMAGGSARHITDAMQAQNAIWLAEGILSSKGSVEPDGWNEDGNSLEYHWQIQSGVYPGTLPHPTAIRLHRIELTMTWDGGSRPGRVQLVTLLPERKPLPAEGMR